MATTRHGAANMQMAHVDQQGEQEEAAKAVSERDQYRATLAHDLGLHHQMLHELHRRVLALEEAAKNKPRIALIDPHPMGTH
jgi:hypothetical protein